MFRQGRHRVSAFLSEAVRTVVLIVILILAVWLMFLRRDARTAEQAVAVATEAPVMIPVLLVNGDHPLPEDYDPGELVNLYEQKRHFLLARSDLYLARPAFEAANAMFLHAEQEDMNGFILTSGWRSREKQQALYDEGPVETVQKPGRSEHETGLAFDVTARSSGSFEDTEQFQWLYAHCWEHGFILRYPKDKEDITGIAYEPWHYRYVGVELALYLRDTGLTLEEYAARYSM